MRTSTLGHDLRDLYGNEITMGHKLEKMTLSRELKDPNGREMTLGHR